MLWLGNTPMRPGNCLHLSENYQESYMCYRCSPSKAEKGKQIAHKLESNVRFNSPPHGFKCVNDNRINFLHFDHKNRSCDLVQNYFFFDRGPWITKSNIALPTKPVSGLWLPERPKFPAGIAEHFTTWISIPPNCWSLIVIWFFDEYCQHREHKFSLIRSSS